MKGQENGFVTVVAKGISSGFYVFNKDEYENNYNNLILKQ